jgi:tellurite resistance protein TerC
MHHSLTEWAIFTFIVIFLLCLDLGILNKKDHVMNFRQSVLSSLFYFSIACIFGYYIHQGLGIESAREYFAGFLIEKAMSIDNIFVISVIFNFFAIPILYQQRVLLWGVLGVIVFRGVMIGFGSSLIARFDFILYIFAIVLVFTGIKIIYFADKSFDIKELAIYKLLQKYVNLTSEIRGYDFFVRINNKLHATPLFAALVIIETMDLVFAIDSLPAIFAITTDPYIIYTSNIFAILGLRALFFCLSDMTQKFHYLKYFLGLILIFIGIKIFIAHFIPIPVYISLSVTIFLLVAGVAVSVLKSR